MFLLRMAPMLKNSAGDGVKLEGTRRVGDLREDTSGELEANVATVIQV